MVIRKPVPGASQPPSISLTSPSHHANNPWAQNSSPPYPVSPAPARAPPAIPLTAPQGGNNYFELEADTKATAEEPEEKDWWDESDDEDDLEAHKPLQPERTEQNQAPVGPDTAASEHNLPNALRIGHAPATQSTSDRTSGELKDTGFVHLSLQDGRPQPAQDYQTYTRFGQSAAPNLNSVALENPAGEWAETKLATNVSAGPPPYPLPPPPLTPQLSQSPAIGTPVGQNPLKRTQSSNQPPLIPVLPEDPWTDQAANISNPKRVSAQAFSAASQATDDPWASVPDQPNPTTPIKPPKLNAVAPPLPDRGPSSAETPQVERRKRNEFYEIKNIRWRDGQQLRQSPILVQNANGPCPLLALVNALVLTTPANGNTALIEALSYKEQVSLGLLLDAVFDELTSGRRGTDLPDIGDLYSFLITLHTGMNVNPRFVDAGEEAQAEAPTHPGTFEETKEMRLYSTFDIPLIHGWIPDPSDSAYSAFHRQKVAQTYDDAQNMQFHAEELEAKFHAEGLSEEEQDIFTDVIAIKEFLTTYPTQLSEYGLEVFKQCIEPGQVVILFRNDHFSTLYKQPGTGRLLVLVTDAGYSTHDEIVWESLADVNGMNAELFSGDFRSVSNTTSAGGMSSASSNEWQTVTGKNARRQQGESNSIGNVYNIATSSDQHNSDGNAAQALTQAQIIEQEDHDLALALQLQEEEEAQQRSMSADRAREVEASEHYLSQHPSQRPSAAPAARQSSTSVRRPSQQEQPPAQPQRPNRVPVGGVSRAQNADEFGEDAAPPPYEPVQRTKPTLQPPQRPPNSVAAGQGSYTVPRRQSSNTYGNNSPGMGYMPQSPAGSMPPRRRLQSQASVGGASLQQNAGGRSGGQNQTEERCAIM